MRSCGLVCGDESSPLLYWRMAIKSKVLVVITGRAIKDKGTVVCSDVAVKKFP